MKQHARTHADLEAMLIGQKTVPKGCRVLNVSPQGMMLQCEPDGRLLTFRDADLVDVHLTVQHGGGRKKFAIPSIVNRVDIKSIDVVFLHPNSELLKLIEAYRISDTHMMEASIALSPLETSAKVSTLPNTMANAATVETGDAGGKQESRGILYPVLATLILSVCIATGAYLYTSGIDSRLGVLETITINQTNELADIRSRIYSSSLQEGRFASLNARMQSLTDAFTKLEENLNIMMTRKPAISSASEIDTNIGLSDKIPVMITADQLRRDTHVSTIELAKPGIKDPDKKGAVEKNLASKPDQDFPSTTNMPRNIIVAEMDEAMPADEAAIDADDISRAKTSTTNQTVIMPTTSTSEFANKSTGPWIINLLSSRKKLDTDRLAEVAATNGIPVVQNRAIVKGKEYWRLQVTGFGNATEAKNYAIPVKKKLGIQDVWIFQQKE